MVIMHTEFSHGDGAKNTWLVCQGYYYEDEPQKVDGADTRALDVGERKALVSQSVEATFIGMPTCDKHLLNGVTIRFFSEGDPMNL